MNAAAKWGIILGAGIPGILILIGILGLLIKFFMKRCRRRAWTDITSASKLIESTENSNSYRQTRNLPSEREPLVPPVTTTQISTVSEGHVVVPISDTDLPPGQQREHTRVQIQRERLNRLKEEENRTRPMLRLSTGELDIQNAIDLAQKEFDESV